MEQLDSINLDVAGVAVDKGFAMAKGNNSQKKEVKKPKKRSRNKQRPAIPKLSFDCSPPEAQTVLLGIS